ncbi:MAG: radical SAM protein [Dysgonamonadaceae bacterium]|nr:radical SAM protein [Dysgonamonadaceae bacterium]
MPNLMLTNWCNYKCPYCFGIDFMAPKIAKKNMSQETFCNIVAWLLKTPEYNAIHLMGGEPTLHPNFEWMVEYLLARDFRITVFSNLATNQAQGYAEKLADLPVAWVVNINPPNTWNNAQKEKIMSALQALKQRATITFNVMPDDDDNNWAIELINECNLNRCIKVGFVLPTVTGANYYLNDEQYEVVAEKVVRLALDAEKENIRLEYECGVPTCIFSEEQLGILWDTGSVFNSACCSRLDITPDGECIYCLPLATKNAVHFSEFSAYPEIKHWFETKLRPYRRLGRTENCPNCNLMRPDSCNGGCLAKILLNAKNV